MDNNAEAIRQAARIADRLLEQAEDGTKLIALHRYYPTGTRAFSVGFHMMAGAITALAMIALGGRAINWALTWVIG